MRLKTWQVAVLAVLGTGALCTSILAIGALASMMGVLMPAAEVSGQMVQLYARQTVAGMAAQAPAAASQAPAAAALPTRTLIPTLTSLPVNPPTATPLPPTPALPAIGACAAFNTHPRQRARVLSVVDGDTIDVLIGEQNYKVRYIGMNTPERGEANWSEASRLNAALVQDQVVTLVKDVSETDRFGRLLRYVFVGEAFVNYELVRQGYAAAVSYPPDTACDFTFQTGQLEAQAGNRGMWAAANQPTVPMRLPPTRPVFMPPTQTARSNAVCNCRGPDLDCRNFGTHASAQACFDYCRSLGYGDVFGLDRDHDGLACEN